MRYTVEVAAQVYELVFADARSIAIPLDFDGLQPNLFDVPSATRVDLEAGDFVGNVQRGGSCNVDTISLIPHCHGTHTESAGHILQQPDCVLSAIGEEPILAAVVSVHPESCSSHLENYPHAREEDRVITADALQEALRRSGLHDLPFSGMVLRTLPNEPQKKTLQYNSEPVPPYLTSASVDFLDKANVRHLFVDVPSIDRVFDRGRLQNHRQFWGVDATQTVSLRSERTITEMVYVPDDVPDGLYLIDLQVPSWRLHAVPSRPVLVPLRKTTSV